jgi:hypothetical protein
MVTPVLRNDHPAAPFDPRWQRCRQTHKAGSAVFTMDYAQNLINGYFSSSAVDI